MKKLFLMLAKGLGLLVLGFLYLWFILPQNLLRPPDDPELTAFYEEQRKKRHARLIRQAFEQWQRKENEARSQRAWKNRNDFYRKGRKK